MPGRADRSLSFVGRVIDSLTGYIDATAELPLHTTITKRAPRVILPDDCPLLLVTLAEKNSVPLTTISMDKALRLVVAWYENAVEDVATLGADPDLSESLLLNQERIEAAVDRMSRLDRSAFEPGVYEVETSRVSYEGQELQEGLVEGYALDVLIGIGARADG